jgi:outer membrane receptor protein involved in Fe transport
LTEGFYGGFEFTRRDVTQPNKVGKEIEFSGRDEELYRAYLYWTPHPYWSLNAEYRFERDVLSFELETNLAPVAIRYFGPRGFFGQFGSTFVWQKKDTSDGERLSDNFAVVDAAIGYRFPKRWGIVSLEINNLFDEEFRFEDATFKTSDQFDVNHLFLPDRMVLVRVVLNF